MDGAVVSRAGAGSLVLWGFGGACSWATAWKTKARHTQTTMVTTPIRLRFMGASAPRDSLATQPRTLSRRPGGAGRRLDRARGRAGLQLALEPALPGATRRPADDDE